MNLEITIINLTESTCEVRDKDDSVLFEVEPTSIQDIDEPEAEPEAEPEESTLSFNGCEVLPEDKTEAKELPKPKGGTFYIVSREDVKLSPGRSDLLVNDGILRSVLNVALKVVKA